ncbi:sulfate adenylyltransferase [candidate division KSB1 bacterium]|nr:sulfate adenylyltransferase [candidate division KSB1 bacterium]
MSLKLVPPHGGMLKPLLLEGEALVKAREQAKALPGVRMSSRETSDIIMLAVGAFSPLDGFMVQSDYEGVVENMHLSDGTLWPMPITLAVSQQKADTLSVGDDIALVDDESGELMGSMTIQDKYTYDKKNEALKVFRTEDGDHPGVAKIYAQGDVYLGGPVKVFSEGEYPALYKKHYGRPAETRALFESLGWKTVAAFQTRNPIHRSHEYCTKIAMEVCDGVFIHPIVGKLKGGDIPADVRLRCYEVLLEQYYPRDRVVMKVYPMEMRYGGPREAVLHAIFRQNYGCSHLIVGRDHAGVGSYYGPFDAQVIFDEIEDGELHIEPLKIDWTFWCHKCDGMASMKTCPHGKEERVLISGTAVREMLGRGEKPPKEFSRPEVAEILIQYYQSLTS